MGEENCEKCGYKRHPEHTLEYIPEGHPIRVPECLRHTCGWCGFVWKTPCVGAATNKDPLIEPAEK